MRRWSEESSTYEEKYYELFLPPPTISYSRRAEIGSCRVEVGNYTDLQEDENGNYKIWVKFDIYNPGKVHSSLYALSAEPKDPASRLGMRCYFINKKGEKVKAYYQKWGEQAVFRANTLVEVLADKLTLAEIVRKERRYITGSERTLGGMKGFSKGKYTSPRSTTRTQPGQDAWRFIPIKDERSE